MENQLVLPAEIAQIAESVSVEKRTEVQTVLNHVFNGVSKMREQLDSVTVTDQNDRVNMKLANTIRLGVRQVRLEAEKTFDAKRSEVQQQMLSYKTEDQLWLKAKQTMQLLTKEIEENARWKEETKERFEAEQKELKVQQRLVKILLFAPEISRSEIENMSDETFNVFLSGIEKAYNDRIEAEKKAEADRIAKEQAEKEEQERVRKENERLKKEAEEKEKQLKAEKEAREKEEERREKVRIEMQNLQDKRLSELLPFTTAETDSTSVNMATLWNETEESYQTILKNRKAKFEKIQTEQEVARIAAEKAKAEKEKLEAEIRAKNEVEAKALKEAELKAIADQKAKETAEKKAKNAPDKVKLLEIAKSIDNLIYPEIKGEEAMRILSDVKTLLAKVSVFIKDKSELL